MEREVWVRVGMVTSVLVLGVLILVTPVLLGRPTSELASLPMLIVGWSGNQSYLVVYATGALQQYQYKLIRLAFNESISSVNGTFRENDTYGFHRWVPANASFTVDAYFEDQIGRYFEYNVTVHQKRDADNQVFLEFTFPYEKDRPNPVSLYPPKDFRWSIPPRGTLP
ncbi:MAG: hypothetical protein E6K06_05390 [Methanobacteriota archaeon]|nr:MAG: hypothetical protein E6K09_01455 [Euryarchaeota archaeon]TLZ71951.1 MAG: hypothetical protein E6K06_05390 [Euryarchaeota archaeon]